MDDIKMQKKYFNLELELDEYYKVQLLFRNNFSFITQYKGQYTFINKPLFIFKLIDVQIDIKSYQNAPLKLKYITSDFQMIVENNAKDNIKFGGIIESSDLITSDNSLDYFINKQPYLVVSLVFGSTNTSIALNNYNIQISKYLYSNYKEKYNKNTIKERAINIRHNQCKLISKNNSYYFIYLNNETLQNIYNELNPINLNELHNNELENGYYSWVYISIDNNDPVLYLSKLETPFEFGNRHIELANKIACVDELCLEYKLYYAGELYKDSIMIQFNFLSGSFMANKTYASDFIKGSILIRNILKTKNTSINNITFKGLDIFSDFEFTEKQLEEYISKYKLQIFTDENDFINNIKETNNNSVLVFNNEDDCFNFMNYFDRKRGGYGLRLKNNKIKSKNRSKRKTKRKLTYFKSSKSKTPKARVYLDNSLKNV